MRIGISKPEAVHETPREEGSEGHEADVLSNITSMVQLGSIAGSLLAFLLCERLGRVRTLQALSLLWLVGFIIVITSHGNVPQILGGRSIASLDIGITVVVGPKTYIAEIAPRSVRGMLTSIFAGSIHLGATIAFLSNRRAFFLVLSFTVPETPRYYTIGGKHKQAEKSLIKLRNLDSNHPCILGVAKLVSAYLCATFLIDFVTICLAYIAIFLGVVGEDTVNSGTLTDTQHQATVGAIAMIYLSGFGWAMGWNAVQYLVNADIWSLRLRALGSSLVMWLHFVNQYGNTKAVPAMLLARQSYGFFAFCAIVSFLGLVWVWFFVPELAGRSLESTDALFALPGWQVGRFGNELAPDTRTLEPEQSDMTIYPNAWALHRTRPRHGAHFPLAHASSPTPARLYLTASAAHQIAPNQCSQ
ncbi:major facilitator superfamily domain-containing protein [Aspergillus carlsbadensis]|nr:major facilitator superfamily domain-containing protein [Aspergillus carlsbadensis]